MLDRSLTKLRGVGFRIDELMAGEHEFEPGMGPPGRHPMSFRVTWGPADVVSWLTPGQDKFLWQELEGEVTVGELCEHAPCRGTLELKYFDAHKIRYTFDFTARGQGYHFVGEKVNIWPWNLPFSHTTCFGRITEADTGRLVSVSTTFFRLGTALELLRSFRIARLEPAAAS